MVKQLTILFCNYNDSCCRSSPNTGVSCDATGVVGVWQESTQCGCGLWAIHSPPVLLYSTKTLQLVLSDHSVRFLWITPHKPNKLWFYRGHSKVSRWSMWSFNFGNIVENTIILQFKPFCNLLSSFVNICCTTVGPSPTIVEALTEQV